MDKLFLLDAYALIYRAYYAFLKSPRINSKGLNTSAIMGFVNTLEEILDGNSKISASQLTFIDSIKTRDETKDLSKEINNMVGIIRGIIPYISYSTLQAADKDTKKELPRANFASCLQI